MGVTAMIPDATIGQLRGEAAQRWGEIWDPAASRTRVLMMMPRRERKLYEMHGDLVEHGQPVISMFHRPRAEAGLLEEQGLDPRDASFLFVDLAASDLGRWLQHLVTNEGWFRSTVEVQPVPFEMGLPTQRRFEAERVLLFRHPDLPAFERYFLPFPLDALPGKAYVSLPARLAAEHARQQAEVLGVGRLERQQVEDLPAEPEVEAPADEAPQQAPSEEAPASQPQTAPVPLPEHEPAERGESLLENVSRRVDEAIEEMVGVEDEEMVEAVPLPATVSTVEDGSDAAPAVQEEALEAPPVPAPAEPPAPVEDDMSPIEREFRDLVEELKAAGIEPGSMMDDPRWEGLNERAVAAGIDAWGIFVEMIGEQG